MEFTPPQLRGACGPDGEPFSSSFLGACGLSRLCRFGARVRGVGAGTRWSGVVRRTLCKVGHLYLLFTLEVGHLLF